MLREKVMCIDTFSGEVPLIFFSLWPPFLVGQTLEGKNLLPKSKFYHSREDLVLENNIVRGSKQEVTKAVSLRLFVSF